MIPHFFDCDKHFAPVTVVFPPEQYSDFDDTFDTCDALNKSPFLYAHGGPANYPVPAIPTHVCIFDDQVVVFDRFGRCVEAWWGDRYGF